MESLFSRSRITNTSFQECILLCEEAAYQAASCFQRSAELNDPQQIQNDEDDGKNNQSVDPSAGFRETWAYIRT